MLRYRNIIIAAAAVLCLAACDEDDAGIAPSGETFAVGQVRWSADVAEGDRAVIAGLVADMVKVDACSFYMGAQYAKRGSANYLAGYSARDTATWVGPVTVVAVPDYYIGRFEVSQGQWEAVMGDVRPTGNYCKDPDVERDSAWYSVTGRGADIAAYNISKADAELFCRTLSAKTGLAFRLPTEAEWECAARGGKYSLGYRYVGSDNYADVSWCYGNASAQGKGAAGYGVHAGGELRANELGLYDMSGNVAEWVSGSYYKYSASDATNPQGGVDGDTLILRGGSWVQKSSTDFAPATRRKFILSSYSEQSFLDAIAFCGFRVALSSQ